MNVKRLATSAFLVQNGALFLSVNYKLAYGLQTVNNLVFCCRYAGWYLQLSHVKPMWDYSGPAKSQPVFACLSVTKLDWRQRTGSKYDKNEQLTLLSQRKLAFTGRNMLKAL